MDCNRVKLGELITAAKTVRCGGNQYPILSMTMHDGLVFQDEKFKKVIASKDTSDYKVVFRNQLVISFPIDEGVLAAQRIVDAGIVSPAYGIWDINSNLVIPEFLELSLRCNRAIAYYKANLRGSTARRRSLPTPTLLEFEVPLPSIEMQRCVLDLIHKAKQIIVERNTELAKLDELIKARFVEMIDKEKTVSVKLKDLVDPERKITYGMVKPGKDVKGGVIIIKVKNFPDGVILNNDFLHSDPQLEAKYARSRVIEGDLLYSIRGTVGRTAFVTKELEGANITQDTARISVDSKRFNANYVKYALGYDKVSAEVEKQIKGVAMRGISLSELREIEIPCVEFEKQSQFGKFVIQVDKSKVVVRRALNKAQQLFDSLMQEYFG